MLKGKDNISKKCARIIRNVLVMTRLKDKKQLTEIMGQMCETAEKSPEYDEETKKLYKIVFNFFKQVWKEDLDAIIEIVFKK